MIIVYSTELHPNHMGSCRKCTMMDICGHVFLAG
ncbi:hypothetical protein HU200_050108 [Digitaria exilis]|uniref:Uncharacterized protein n=1 Tax=Digitaria exilis TaxID=1010633 RepID=A0A835AS99_9POAL|nr:hypothetical protein HU200_050108 [Digitaria exilis]